ncbi:MAG: ATP-binding protein [Acidobacteriota bacterium]
MTDRDPPSEVHGVTSSARQWVERLKATRTQRLTTGFVTAMLIVLALFLPILLLDSAWYPAMLASVACLGALRLRHQARRGVPGTGALVLALYWLVATVSSATTGGLGTVSIGWVFLCPLVGGLMLGRRGAVAGSAMTFTSLLGLVAAEHTHFDLPIFVDDQFGAVHDVTDAGALAIAGGLFVWLYLREQRWAELEMLQSIARLEREVEVRSVAEQEAVRAQQAEQRFLAVASHELRTPLNGVLGLTQILAGRDLGRDTDPLIRELQAAGLQLRTLVDQILDFSATSVAQRAVAPFDLDQIVSSTRSVLAAQAPPDVEVRFELESGLPTRRLGHGDRVAQVLLNLGGNALKFTEQGEIVLGARRSEAPEQVCLIVRDTGIGFDSRDAERLFEPFVRVHRGATAERGLGLGLAIVRDAVHAMDGAIRVESTEGVGTTFFVDLPLPVVDEPPRGAAAKSGAVSSTQPAPSASPRRALVAEDDPLSSFVLTTFLEELGWSVTHVADGARALDELTDGAYRLGLIDGDLPARSGDEVARELRRRGLDTPLVAVTAFAMPGDRERFLDAGMNAYLSKPVRFEDLQDLLDTLDP